MNAISHHSLVSIVFGPHTKITARTGPPVSVTNRVEILVYSASIWASTGCSFKYIIIITQFIFCYFIVIFIIWHPWEGTLEA